MNPESEQSGEWCLEGKFCRVVLAMDEHGRHPLLKEFFGSKQVGAEDIKKLTARLTNIARHGYPPNREAYKRFGDLHYVKTHGFRALCFERVQRRRRELVVTVIVPKKNSDSLPEAVKHRAWDRFEAHCKKQPKENDA